MLNINYMKYHPYNHITMPNRFYFSLVYYFVYRISFDICYMIKHRQWVINFDSFVCVSLKATGRLRPKTRNKIPIVLNNKYQERFARIFLNFSRRRLINRSGLKEVVFGESLNIMVNLMPDTFSIESECTRWIQLCLWRCPRKKAQKQNKKSTVFYTTFSNKCIFSKENCRISIWFSMGFPEDSTTIKPALVQVR